MTEHPEAAAAGLAKWDVVPYATRPVFDAATLRPLGGFVGTYVPGYDLAVHPVRVRTATCSLFYFVSRLKGGSH